MLYRRMMIFVSLLGTALAFQPPCSRRTMMTHKSRGVSSSLNMLESLDDSNYRQVLLRPHGSGDHRVNGSTSKAVLVDCSATWCGPCKLIEPVVERAQEKWSNQLDVYKFNVDNTDNNKDTKLELLLQGVMPRALPSLILFHDGKAIANHKGVITDDELDEFLEGQLPIEVMYRMKNTNKKVNGESGASTRAPGYVSFAAEKADDYMLTGL